MANERFEMVAKTFQGLEDVLAEELRALGAENVEPGKRMVSFEGDLEMLYRANLSCRTALRILKPIYKFIARDTDELYEYAKEFDWGKLMSPSSTFAIDTVAYSDEFTHSRFVTYRIKDAIVDWFKDRYGDDVRPGVRLQDADVMINVHIAGDRVTLSLDSSGESLHKRGYRVAQTEAPINEVLAAGIILKSGWRGDCPLVDPMCGSGTFLIEAALIAANINPGVYRRHFSFENWRDFDPELFDRLYNDDSNEKEFNFKIYGADISPKAVEIAEKNIKSAGVGRMIELETKPLSAWTEAPANGVLVTNPPYGERISSDDMEGLYELIGSKLKNVFKAITPGLSVTTRSISTAWGWLRLPKCRFSTARWNASCASISSSRVITRASAARGAVCATWRRRRSSARVASKTAAATNSRSSAKTVTEDSARSPDAMAMNAARGRATAASPERSARSARRGPSDVKTGPRNPATSLRSVTAREARGLARRSVTGSARIPTAGSVASTGVRDAVSTRTAVASRRGRASRRTRWPYAATPRR